MRSRADFIEKVEKMEKGHLSQDPPFYTTHHLLRHKTILPQSKIILPKFSQIVGSFLLGLVPPNQSLRSSGTELNHFLPSFSLLEMEAERLEPLYQSLLARASEKGYRVAAEAICTTLGSPSPSPRRAIKLIRVILEERICSHPNSPQRTPDRNILRGGSLHCPPLRASLSSMILLSFFAILASHNELSNEFGGLTAARAR
jgi:hypothetical protein